MSNKVYVGGLSWGTDDQGLLNAFQKFGAVVEAKVIIDRDTGRSRGFGFVTFDNSDSAQRAIQEMDGSSLDGRTLKVNLAQDRGDRGGRGPGGGGGGRGGGGYGGGGGGGRGPGGGGRGGGGGRW